MTTDTLEHRFVVCQISQDETGFVGKLSYLRNDNGQLSGPTRDAIQSQYDVICHLIDTQGGMLRRGCIMLGYHSKDLKGDVLLLDGEVIGRWEMEDDDDMSHFFLDGQSEALSTAPSAWMLHEVIADWLEKEGLSPPTE